MKALKIAQVVPIYLTTPPATRGGTEKIASDLTEQLVKFGHDVTLFATKNSKTNAKLKYLFPKPITEMPNWGSWPQGAAYDYILAHLSWAFSEIQKQKFDIVHVHFNEFAFPFSNFTKTPVITTYHNTINPKIHNLYKKLYHFNCVSISNQQRKNLTGFTSTIYNGLNLKEIPYSEKKEDYLITAGRIVEDKGIKESIALAKKTKQKLIIIGNVYKNIPRSHNYYNQYIKKYVDNKNIIHYQNLSHQKLLKLFSKAKAFIFPLQWDEPFGLVLIEAMACGTPAIALRRGAIPEVIKHGYSGYIAGNMQQMTQYIKKIDTIKPSDCRQHVQKNFSIEKITQDYLNAYKKIINH